MNYAFHDAFVTIEVMISVIKLTIEKFFVDEIFSLNVLKFDLPFLKYYFLAISLVYSS